MAQAGSNVEQAKQDAQATNRFSRKAMVSQRLQRVTQQAPSPLLLGGILFVAALALNLYRLGAPGIWFDEAFSVELARQPLPLLWHIIFGSEPNMELYYLFLHFWLALTGTLGLNPTEFVVRFPSAIFAALSTVIVFLWGRRFIGTTAGVIGAALYLLNDLQLLYAQQARAYSLQLLLTCLAWYALLAALTGTSHRRRWWVCYCVATVLAVYTHLFSGLIILAQLVAVGGILLLPNSWRASARTQLKSFGISVLAAALLMIPMGIVARTGAKTGWLPAPHLSDLLQLFVTISGYKKYYLFAIALCCLLGVVLVALSYRQQFLFFAKTKGTAPSSDIVHEQRVPATLALLCWFVLPIVVSYAISQGSLRLFSERYLVTIVPPLCLLVGLGVTMLPWRRVQILLSLALLLMALVAVPFYYQNAQVEDWNVTTHWLQQRYQQDDGLICYDNSVQQGCQISVEYYLHAYPTGAHFTADAPGAFSWDNLGPANPQAGPDAAVDPAVLAAYGTKHARIFFIVGRVRDDAAAARAQAAQRWLDAHYQRLDQIVTRTVTIYLYQTNA